MDANTWYSAIFAQGQQGPCGAQGISGLGAGQGDAEPPQLEWRVTRFKVVRHNSEKDRLKVARTNLRSLNWSDQPIAVGRGNTQWRKGC